LHGHSTSSGKTTRVKKLDIWDAIAWGVRLLVNPNPTRPHLPGRSTFAPAKRPSAIDRVDQAAHIANGKGHAAPLGLLRVVEGGRVVHHIRAVETDVAIDLHHAPHVHLSLIHKDFLEVVRGAADIAEMDIGDLALLA